MANESDRILHLYLDVLELPEEEQVSYIEQLGQTDPTAARKLLGIINDPEKAW